MASNLQDQEGGRWPQPKRIPCLMPLSPMRPKAGMSSPATPRLRTAVPARSEPPVRILANIPGPGTASRMRPRRKRRYGTGGRCGRRPMSPSGPGQSLASWSWTLIFARVARRACSTWNSPTMRSQRPPSKSPGTGSTTPSPILGPTSRMVWKTSRPASTSAVMAATSLPPLPCMRTARATCGKSCTSLTTRRSRPCLTGYSPCVRNQHSARPWTRAPLFLTTRAT
jgi:hypothetical protein